MKIVANKEICSGHARCNSVDEDLFPVDDLGYLEVNEISVPAGQEDTARKAVGACPERALKIVED